MDIINVGNFSIILFCCFTGYLSRYEWWYKENVGKILSYQGKY